MTTEKERKFSENWKASERALMFIAMKYEGRRLHDAEDLFQDTMLKAFKNFDKFDPKYKFSTWAGIIMRNTFIDKYRKVKDVHVSGLDTTDEMNICNTIPNGEYSKFMKSFDVDYLRKHSEEVLSEKLRKPYEMWAKSYQYNEISETLGLPIGTVKSYVHQAKTKIMETFPR